MLAASRINSFVVIFGYENGGFMAPLYPYFFNVDAFPGVELVGLTRAQQERNAEAFRRLIRTAHERGIAVTAGIWDHIYRGRRAGRRHSGGVGERGQTGDRAGVRRDRGEPRGVHEGGAAPVSAGVSRRSTPSSSACTTSPG